MIAAQVLTLCSLTVITLVNASLDETLHHYEHEIFIDPTNPNSINNVSCYTSGSQLPCADINFALAFSQKTQSTAFFLRSNATHYLKNNSATTMFDGADNVAFIGDGAVVECVDGAGLAFVNSTQILLQGVSFRKCGAWRNSTSKDFTAPHLELLQIRVALYFYNCRDVSMFNMSVVNSTEAVGVVMYSTAGVNNISHSRFDGNRISENNTEDSGGGGFAVEFNYCRPGDNNCSDTNHQMENNQNAAYIFEHCFFRNNRGIDQSGKNKTDISVLPHNESHFSLGRGGGLSLYFKGNTTNVNVTLDRCYFENNYASWGAGMIVEFVDSTVQTVVNVLGCYFHENECYYQEESKGGPGGGVRVASFVYYTSQLSPNLGGNSILFQQCTFTSNKALFGGAMSISFHLQPYSSSDQLFQAYVVGTSFQFNHARLGSAVSVDRDHYFTTGQLGQASFDGCVFNNNTIEYTQTAKPYSVGAGALFISEIAVTFGGYMFFEQNNGTALAIVGTTVTIEDETLLLFSKNFGSEGGAIALLGMSNMIIGRKTNFTFVNNSASLYGGAIFNNYIGKEDLRSSIKCFLQYFDPFEKREKWETLFYFQGNRAGKLGDSIFSSTILPCLWSEGTHAGHDSTFDIFCWNSSIWVYKNSSCQEEIYTFPRTFLLPDKAMSIFPGQQFQLPIHAFDDLKHNVSDTAVYTAITDNSTTCQVDPKYTYIADGYVGVRGSGEQNGVLELDTASTRDWHLQLPFFMERCPPGFVYVGGHSNGTCECLGGSQLYTYRGNLLCDKTNLVSKITNDYWLGLVPAVDNHTLYMGTTTLLHRLIQNETFPLSRQYDRLDYNQCSYLNRTGPLCGECIEGYSTAVNSYNYECVPCTSNTTNFAANIAAYIGLTYLPYLIVLVLIIVFDVRLMSGPLVGFILYAQLIGSGVVDLTTNNLPYLAQYKDLPPKLQKAYRIVYGVFNLNSLSELMDPFCVHAKFSALDVISLDFAVAVLPLLLIPLVHLVIKCLDHIKMRRLTTNPMEAANAAPQRPRIHALVGFMYLSYTKFTLASTKILSTTSIFDKDGSTVRGINLIYYAGQYYFGQPEYILPYGLLAIIVFSIVAVLLPLLLLGPFDFINWLTDRPRFQSLNNCWPSIKINIFLDAFRGCYRQDFSRFFTGIYFLFRLTVFIIFAFSTNDVTNRAWQLAFLFLLTVLVAGKQPYRVRLLNLLDVAIFFNLTVIDLISIYLYTTHILNVRNGYPLEFYVVGLILIWLPMIYFLVYLLWRLVHNRQFYKRLCNYVTGRVKRFSDYGTPEERQHLLTDPSIAGSMRTTTDIEQDPLTDSGMFRRALEPNRYQRPVSQSSVEMDDDGLNHTATSGIATGGSQYTNSSKGSGRDAQWNHTR